MVLKKAKESLGQALKDVDLFLTMFPDLTSEDLTNSINFTTMSILPATLSKSLPICSNCHKSIIFREDLNPDFVEFDSLAELLNADMTLPTTGENKISLKKKLQVSQSFKPSKPETLNLVKKMAARLVGMGSLFFPKTYGPSRSFYWAVKNMMEETNRFVSKNLEIALYLSSEQVKALNSFNFVVTGFYGVGKTTVLEVAIDNITKNYSCPKIVVLTWDTSLQLKNTYEERFAKCRAPNQTDACFEVLSLGEACAQYQVNPVSFYFSNVNRSKVDVINDLCKNIQGE
jgi:hypothetical protein